MTRGHGSLFVATRVGVAVAAVPVRAAREPGPTWWAHHCATAWTAAWIRMRGRDFLGPRELLERRTWQGEISWQDRKGSHVNGHRPDLVAALGDRHIAFEVELAQKSADRLRSILWLHACWRTAGKTGGVLYVCGDQDGCDRIRKIAESTGMLATNGGGLRIELLETIKAHALAARQATRAAVTPASPIA